MTIVKQQSGRLTMLSWLLLTHYLICSSWNVLWCHFVQNSSVLQMNDYFHHQHCLLEQAHRNAVRHLVAAHEAGAQHIARTMILNAGECVQFRSTAAHCTDWKHHKQINVINHNSTTVTKHPYAIIKQRFLIIVGYLRRETKTCDRRLSWLNIHLQYVLHRGHENVSLFWAITSVFLTNFNNSYTNVNRNECSYNVLT